jgi:predicted ATP-grasp superfamily ATP-dependent carboligase
MCLGRFSRFVTHYYRSPAFGVDPWAYFEFVVDVLSQGSWDVLLPTHEQAFLFSRERASIPSRVGVALSDFQSFLQLQGKSALVKTLRRLEIPQPESFVLGGAAELRRIRRFPFFLKTDYATASRGVWKIQSARELQLKCNELESALFDEGQEFVVQEVAEGPLERVQAIFNDGELIAIHGYRQLAEGPGGGDIAKIGINRAIVRDYMIQIGRKLRWHGALSFDYVFAQADQSPLFIDANPRLVEPMNATLSGVNLADLLVRVSICDRVQVAQPGVENTRTHMLLMALLSVATTLNSRRAIAAEFFRAILRRGIYSGSQEELLPLTTDFKGIFPLVYVFTRLLIRPGSAGEISLGSIAAYSMGSSAAQQIASKTRR